MDLDSPKWDGEIGILWDGGIILIYCIFKIYNGWMSNWFSKYIYEFVKNGMGITV